MTLCKKLVLCSLFVVFGLLSHDVYAHEDCCAPAYSSVITLECCVSATASPCCTLSGACCTLRILSNVNNSLYIESKTLGIPCSCAVKVRNVFGAIFKPPRI